MLTPLLFCSLAVLATQDSKKQGVWPWPPPGAAWETDPAQAFARARRENKPVMVYIATATCPHCKVMTRGVWPEKPAIEACAQVVCLAVHRYRKDPKNPRAHPPSDWAIRMDVMAYPQFRFLDPSGVELPVGANPRSVAALVAAIGEARAAFAARQRAALKGRGPAGLPVEQLAARAAIGIEKLPSGRFEKLAALEPHLPALAKHATKLLEVFRVSDDALLQLAVLDVLAPDLTDIDVRTLLYEAIRGKNDYVRTRALKILVAAKGSKAAVLIGDLLQRAAGKTAPFRNPNNVLMATLQAAKQVPHPGYVPALQRVLETRTGRNIATLYAVEALVSIASEHGRTDVADALSVAAKLEGHHAERIRLLLDTVRK